MRPKVFVPIRQDDAFACLDGIRNDQGTPLWRAFLQTLREFDVFVDTDSELVMRSVESDPDCRCAVFMRDSKFRGEEITTNDLIASFLDRYWIQHESVIQTHITHPFLTPQTLQTAWEFLTVGAIHDSVMSVDVRLNRIWSSDATGHFPINHNPMNLRRTTQLAPICLENSAFYVFTAERFRALRNRLGLNPMFYEIKAPEAASILSTECWRDLRSIATSLAGWEMSHLAMENQPALVPAKIGEVACDKREAQSAHATSRGS